MNRNIFGVWILLAAVVVSTDSALRELFSQLDNNNTHKIQSDIINNEYNSVLCWLETINSVEYRNGTHTTDRQFSMILESPGNLSNTSIDKNGSDDETKKSKVHKFSTLYKGKNFNIRVNKTLLCGTSKVITKEYTRWASNKQRIQINLGSEKLLDKCNLKVNDSCINSSNNNLNDTLITSPNLEKLNRSTINNITNLHNNSSYNSFETISNTQKLNVSNTSSKMTGKKEKKSKNKKRKASSEYYIMNEQENISMKQDTIKSLDSHRYVQPSNCNYQHKISIKIQLVVEHLLVDKITNEDFLKIPLESVEKRQDFNIKFDQKPKFKANEDDVNRCWERLVKLLSREYFINYYEAVIPFIELPPGNIEENTNSFGEVIAFNQETRRQLISAQKYVQECERQQNIRK